MKYAFIKLKGKTKDGLDSNVCVYMQPGDYDRYKDKPVFSENALSLDIYENIHIGIFPLMFTEKEILDYNPDACIKSIMPLSDIAFTFSSTSHVAKLCDCDNV